MELTLTAEEHEFLTSILEQRHRELMKEIWHTDHRQFKELLHRQDRLIESMLTHLRSTPMETARAI
jgi:hypothetical protein